MKTQVRTMMAACRSARWWVICVDAVVPMAVVLAVVDMSSVASVQDGGSLSVGKASHEAVENTRLDDSVALHARVAERGPDANSATVRCEARGKDNRLISSDDRAIDDSACFEGMATSGTGRLSEGPVAGMRGTISSAGSPTMQPIRPFLASRNVAASLASGREPSLASRLDGVEAGVWSIRGDVTDERWHIADGPTLLRGAS